MNCKLQLEEYTYYIECMVQEKKEKPRKCRASECRKEGRIICKCGVPWGKQKEQKKLVKLSTHKGAGTPYPRAFKGTVSRDFRLLFFFINQFPPSYRVYQYGHVEFFRKFAEIFAAQGAQPVSLTPVANGKNHQSEKF
jgi:hypothetical protein